MLGGGVRKEVKRAVLRVSDQPLGRDIRFRVNNHLVDVRIIRVSGSFSILTSRIDEIVEDGILVFPRSPSDKISSIVSVMLFADSSLPPLWF